MSGWNSKSAASRFKHNIFYLLIKCGGRPLASCLLVPVVAFYALVPAWRRRAYPYIERRFKNTRGLAKIYHAWRLYFCFGQVLIDRAAYGITGRIKILSSAADMKLCRDLHALGKGLIILSAHCGAWQCAMSAFDFIEEEKYVIYRRDGADIDKQAYEHGKIAQAVKFIDPSSAGGGAAEIMAALSRNAVICAMGDRRFGSARNLAEAEFLGGTIALPASLYRIAAACGAPVVIIFFPLRGAGRFDSRVAGHFLLTTKAQK
ncbi:MAG: lipid A biosynthesis acyltransferase [Elusimicrobiota bacterium]|jgi:predicted LPLAT superfamily acyltransferase|nr:lipid A biosynthesis acyltransferase [Elusimicrobiota bacterium]